MRLLFVADPLEHFKPHKDTTFAMMRAAAARGHEILACEPKDLVWRRDGRVVAAMRQIALTGDPTDPRHVAVAPAELHAGLTARYPVTRKELAALVTSQPGCMTLDDGEKHLFAWLHASKLLPSNVIVVTTADKAALVASNGLGWLNSMTSLEDLARKAGVGRVNLDALALQYREDWLSSIKTKIMLGIIP